MVSPGYVPTPKDFMHELIMDFRLCWYVKPIGGKRSILVVIDRFLRWFEACPTKGKNAQSVAKFLNPEIISWWGLLDCISSDNGREVVDKTVKLILWKLGVQCLGEVYHPQSQSIREEKKTEWCSEKMHCLNLPKHRSKLDSAASIEGHSSKPSPCFRPIPGPTTIKWTYEW